MCLLGILAYTDDIILLAENEENLNCQLDVLNIWCGTNKLQINRDKSKIMHFRGPSVPRTTSDFKCGHVTLEVCETYISIGLLITEHLSYVDMAKAAVKSASRALGLLISKFKCLGGMPFNVYTKLYDTMVWPVLSYGAAIWGTTEHSAVNALQHTFLYGARKIRSKRSG